MADDDAPDGAPAEPAPAHPGELTPTEKLDIAARMKSRGRASIFVGAVIVALLIGGGILLNSVVTSNNAQDKSNVAVNQSSQRADCKTQYSSILAGPVTIRDNLVAQVTSLNSELTSLFGADLLQIEAGQKVTQAEIDTYTAAKSQLDTMRTNLTTSIAAVAALPTTDHAAENGFAFDGHHYPPCPTVGSLTPSQSSK